MGNPCKNTGSPFHDTNSSQEGSTSCRWRSCVPCSRTAGKGTFFPVAIIYTRSLCNCRWEQCSLHSVTAAVFGGSPSPKLGDLTSQGEDDSALYTKPAIFQGVKKMNSPFHLPMSAWDVSPPGELSSITLGFQTSGQAAVAGSVRSGFPANIRTQDCFYQTEDISKSLC